ncbi:MAG TPA: hypothetical protein VIV27_04865 [Halioglobus sp.]
MTIGLLDLNDANLQLWHGDTRVQSPGYVLLQGQQYRFGAAARAAARLQPREINTRYWWQLSTEVLQPALGPARHTGDLVHAHLRQLHQEANNPDEILLAVSGSMQREQLALLLGIVQQCPFDAVGLVNRSVALGSLYNLSERLFHLEIQLHQAVVSELAVRDNTVELQRTTPLPGCGLLQLQERLVEIIAAEFVRQTRFDPRRKAATEQQLYDALPTALRTLQTRVETNVDVNGYQARISAHQLQGGGQRLFDSARECMGLLHPDDHVLVDPLAALLPGLGSAFTRLEIVGAEDVRRALQLHQELLIQRAQALTFVTVLPCPEQKIVPRAESVGASLAATPVVTRPTHLLYRHVARPLAVSGTALEGGGELYWSQQGWQLRGTGSAMVNGTAYLPGHVLATGDAITIGGGQTGVLIEVVA